MYLRCRCLVVVGCSVLASCGEPIAPLPPYCAMDAAPVARVADASSNVNAITVLTGAGQFPVMTAAGSDLAVVFRGFGAHLAREGRLDMLFSSDGGITWNNRRVVVDGPSDDRNPALGSTSSGDLVLAWTVHDSYTTSGAYREERARLTSYVARSVDHGASWEAPRPLNVAPFEWSSPYGKIIRVGNELVLPMYGGFLPVYSSAGKPPGTHGFFSFVLRSTDDGRTWSEPEIISRGYSETAIAAVSPDVVVAALRQDPTETLTFARWTRSTGQWQLGCVITRSGELPGDFVSLPDGRIMLIYGNRRPPYSINARVSADTGLTWSEPFVLSGVDGGGDLGYPSSVMVSDSIVTMYYTDSYANGSDHRVLGMLRYRAPRR